MPTSRVELPVKGMSCASCVAKIERAVGRLAGVEEVRVNLATERATLTYEPARLGVPEVAKAIEHLGYDVPLETLTFSVQSMSCASCVAKIERALLAVPGVARASVNLGTEKATVATARRLSFEDLRRAVETIGYIAAPLGLCLQLGPGPCHRGRPVPAGGDPPEPAPGRRGDGRQLRLRGDEQPEAAPIPAPAAVRPAQRGGPNEC